MVHYYKYSATLASFASTVKCVALTPTGFACTYQGLILTMLCSFRSWPIISIAEVISSLSQTKSSNWCTLSQLNIYMEFTDFVMESLPSSQHLFPLQHILKTFYEGRFNCNNCSNENYKRDNISWSPSITRGKLGGRGRVGTRRMMVTMLGRGQW